MKKTELHELVQECIAEVLAERATNEGYDEFQRADKGSKGVAAKDKAEEDTYGAGFEAGMKAAKTKYKKLAESYKQLKEEGFGLNKDPYESKNLNENKSTLSLSDLDWDFSDSDEATLTNNNIILTISKDELNSFKESWDENWEDLDEARFEKGEDIGKPGKGFLKITKSAGKKYGSEEAGKKVAGAILKKVLDKQK